MFEIPLSDGVMVISWQGVLVLSAIPLVVAAMIALFVSLFRHRRRQR